MCCEVHHASCCSIGTGPIFKGNSDIDQLVNIMQQMGTINEDRWPGCHSLPDYEKLLFNEMPAQPWDAQFPGADAQAVSLLQQLLCYPPCAVDMPSWCTYCSRHPVPQRRARVQQQRWSTGTLPAGKCYLQTTR